MTEPTVEDMLLIERPTPQICLLRFNRPERLNALTRELVAHINATLDAIAADTACRAVILTGVGRAFSAGNDVAAADARNRTSPSGVVERLYWQEQFAGIVLRLRAMPQVTIAAVNGPCAGVALAIALATDLRIAARSAKFLVAAVRIGLTAGEPGITYMLPRLIGAGRAFDILLTGRPILAEEAERIGLCTRLADDDAIVDAALGFAGEVLANSPFAVTHTKRLIWENLDASSFAGAIELENRAQMLASLTDDYKEATAAFTDKRPPVFTGR